VTPRKGTAAATWEPAESLVPWESNPRINDHAVATIASSIERFGFGAPIIARTEDRMVIAGHTRLKAALSLGHDKVPVRFLDITRQEAEALAIADNKTGEIADWDEAALVAVLKGLKTTGVDLLDGLGFTSQEMSKLLESLHQGPDPDYTHKIKGPLYLPRGDQPEVESLCDETKSAALLTEIAKSEAPDDVKRFLELAAHRHTVFDYEQIAEYYAHAPKPVQDLMENSALVIIDFDKAIEQGFVKLSKTLAGVFDHERA